MKPRRRGAFDFFANPFVVLADVMVSLVVIVSLFLLSTTVYSEQMELIAQRDARRRAMATSLVEQLSSAQLVPKQQRPRNESKYRIGDVLEVEDDGTIQRFRFLKGSLDFKPDSTEFSSPQRARKVLGVFGDVILRQRPRIKSIVIEGHATSSEGNAWPLSAARAEKVRSLWQDLGILHDITEDYRSDVYRFLTTHTPDGREVRYDEPVAKIWDPKRFHEWHLQEYQAARTTSHNRKRNSGVIPLSWVIVSGRGDAMRRPAVVEFKVEYTERDAPPIGELLLSLPPELQRKARARGLMSNT